MPTGSSTCSDGESRSCGSKIGECSYGVERCAAGGWSGTCEAGVGPTTEVCDGKDNDCNGRIDDGFANVGEPCSAGVGACLQTGMRACTTGGATIACSVSGLDPTGRVELCGNGIDDDCNGRTDEGFTLNMPCTAGRGACARSGVTICSADLRSTACSATPGTPAPNELCGNNVDDDCDGMVDEGFSMAGQPCSAGMGACLRTGTYVCSADRLSLRCSATAGPPGANELCGNTIDDDCDGMVDEGFGTVGQTCAVGVGACRRTGTYVCSANRLSVQCSAIAGSPAPNELCGNGIDDDCDGMLDEGFSTVGQSCTTGTAPCQFHGTYACSADRLSVFCSTPPVTNELCNGVDDNANSCIDEGFNTGTACSAGTGICRRTGTFVCDANGLGTHCGAVAGAPNASGELCGNLLDDDCDGMVDEGFPNLGLSCSVGRGICQRTGTYVCSTDRLSTVCSATPGAPNASGELCGNGLDDDCDGMVDEGFPNLGMSCSAGLGICQRSGAYVCSTDRLSTLCDATPGAPNASGELCGNTLDDDCDGMVDEGFNVGVACTVGLGICQRSGSYVCTSNGLGTMCSATPGAPNAAGELCGNSLDDDCDGMVDEGFPNLGTACTVGVGACRRTGTYVCSTDRLSAVCSATPGTPSAEICDNVDNNCDGTVDESCDKDADRYCDATIPFVCCPTVCPLSTGSSTLDCNDMNASIHPGAMEICYDNLDSNCDGNLNDGCPSCNPAVDADFDGSNQCLDCNDHDGAIHPGATEACNGVDDNCNGQIDEGFDVDRDGYTTCGTVFPGGGTSAAWVDCNDMSATVHPFACELCALGSPSNTVACGAANDRGNGIDENCNGRTDETCQPCLTSDNDGDHFSPCQGDCNDSNAAVYPGAPELCDGLDNDCNVHTVANCGVGQTCNWAGTPPPDICEDRLICVQSLGPGGMPTGTFTCTSFCNTSFLGRGLGDGCAAGQTCGAVLTPTANLHGCALSSDFGSAAAGAACSAGTTCRSGRCLRDRRLPGPGTEYCTDYCGNNSYCGAGSSCQVWGSETAQCWTSLSFQTRDVGVACNDTTVDCLGGPLMCVDLGGGSRICSRVCCRNSDCPANYYCSLNGPDLVGPAGGYDTVPACWPAPSGAARNRPSGASCSSNDQCASEFCDRNLNLCFDVCCNDSDCPSGLLCNDASIIRTNGHQSFARVCVNMTPANPLQAR
jgi:putative metal-binding protein